jgi:hypothetical protein
MINPATFTVYTDLDVGRLQYVCKSITGELSALISINYLWRAITLNGFLQGNKKKSVAIVLDNRHDKIFRLCQSIIATR